MTKLAAMSVGFSVLLWIGVWAGDGHAEMAPPKIGRLITYECTGPSSKTRTYTIVEVTEDTYRFEGVIDGKNTWAEKPIGFAPTTLALKRDRNDGRGVRYQSFDMDDFADFPKLKPGSKFSGNVRERHDEGKWEWGYKITVGEPMMINHKLLGEIQVIPVTEKRRIYRGKYASTYKPLVYPEKGLVVGWTYKDRNGTQECDLVEFK